MKISNHISIQNIFKTTYKERTITNGTTEIMKNGFEKLRQH